MKLILRVLATAAATGVAAWFVPGIHVSGATLVDKGIVLVSVAIVFGLVNAVVKPLFEILTGCLIVVTLGLFLFVVNAVMLMVTSWVCQQLGVGFSVAGFLPALVGSIVISLVSWLINGALGTRERERA